MNKMSHDVDHYKMCLRSYFTKPANQCGTELKQSSSTFTSHWNVIFEQISLKISWSDSEIVSLIKGPTFFYGVFILCEIGMIKSHNLIKCIMFVASQSLEFQWFK